jgi:hypothetical protein
MKIIIVSEKYDEAYNEKFLLLSHALSVSTGWSKRIPLKFIPPGTDSKIHAAFPLWMTRPILWARKMLGTGFSRDINNFEVSIFSTNIRTNEVKIKF